MTIGTTTWGHDTGTDTENTRDFNVNGSATFTLDLTNATGTLNVRWIKCADGTLDTDDTVSGGAERTLTNPSGFGVSVAYVRHT